MALSRKLREQMLAFCSALSEEDGLNPKEVYGKKNRQNRNQAHRQLRLCRQVAQTLSLVLPSAPMAAIRGLRVQSVQPSAHAARLIVRLDCGAALSGRTKRLLIECLQNAEGWLRAEIAASISRRRVPTLAFELVAELEDERGVERAG